MNLPFDTQPDPVAAPGVTVLPRLPAPARTRWQPLRLGLVNLYRFDDEVFSFEDGRLLLRGNNGTGKSRVLALTLPFLFDGRIDPHRVEPDGDSAKRMEWNLLLGKYDDRLGYAWLEFGRRATPSDDADAAREWGPGSTDDDDPATGTRFLTIGCGMRASAGRGAPASWFFVTDQRVGEEFHLVTETGQPLTRERLIEAIGGRGEVVDTATEYRRLIDRALFGLGEHRYGALVDLLIQLRRPQLSRQLDESLLSEALSEALPPLPRAVIADVADAFRALDDDRDQLEGFHAALEATTAFLDFYRAYAAVAARRRATAVTQANSRYERTRTELRDAERRRDEAAAEVDRLETRRDELQADERAADVEVRTLEASPQMEAARELDRARVLAARLSTDADERDRDLRRADEEVERRQAALERAGREADASRTSVEDARGSAEDAAGRAGLTVAHQRALVPLDLPDGGKDDVLARARKDLGESVERVRRGARLLVTLNGAVQKSEGELGQARHRLNDRAVELDHARDAAADADQALTTARSETIGALYEWARGLTALDAVSTDTVAAELEDWDGAGAGPIAAAADHALADARDRIGRDLAAVARRVDEIEDERAELDAERESLADGMHRAPPPPHTRNPAARESRPGAPFWRLLDLHDGVDTTAAAGYEAALEAAGLLDAWVTPDGALLDEDDAVLATIGAPPRDDGGLTAVLAPAAAPGDAAAARVPAEHVAALLARIGARETGEVWVAPDGRWKVGPLHGRWRKDAVEYLGHAARERARLRRLTEIETQLAALDDRRAGLQREQAELDRARDRATAERAAAPSEDAVRRALFARASAAKEIHRQRERVEEAETAVRVHRERLDDAIAERDRTAADLGLAHRADDPDALLADVQAYESRLTELWAAVTVHADRMRALDDALEARDRAAADRDTREKQARAARRAADDAATRHATLEDAVGSTAAEIVARLEAARQRVERLRNEIEAVGKEREARLLARQEADTETKATLRRLDDIANDRAGDVERFRRLVHAGFLAVAGVELDADAPVDDRTWAPGPAVRAARRVNDVLADVSAEDADWERVQRGLHERFTSLEQTLLPHAIPPAANIDDSLFVVTATFQGRMASMPELHEVLSGEVSHRRNILDAREREVLENHLVGEVATQLHELIRRGETLVAGMNDELAARPTSTGMRLRFAWRPRPDGPELLADARRRLLAADHVWSNDDRAVLGTFLQARIREVREADEAGTWQEHLTRALDYRRWHLFAVEREQDGQWVRLTRRTHGTGSGGEKALALTIPQFAAAAAHYRSAGEHAPRLIALDEAFVGIDGDMRAKCLDLLVRFDLDVVMTSEREWACYPTVPAIAICQLSTRPGIDAVGVHRWVWNGRDRLDVRIEAERAPVPVGAAEREPRPDGMREADPRADAMHDHVAGDESGEGA